MDNEQLILEQARSGSLEAFEQLILAHHDRVYDTLLKLTGNKTDANDLYQETFISAFTAIKKFKGNSAFSTWLYRIAHNTFIDHCKKPHKKHEMLESDGEKTAEDGYSALNSAPARDDAPEKSAEISVFEEKVRKAVLLLSFDYQEPVVLCDIEGFTYEEISEIMGIPIGTVRSRINRGREMLRDIVSKDGTFLGTFFP